MTTTYETFREVIDDVDDLAENFGRASATVTLIRTGAATRRDFQGLQAAAVGLRGEAREIRRGLDAVDAVDFLAVEDGQRVIQTWTWQREIRRSLTRMTFGLIGLERMVDEVVAGHQRRTVLVRQGDTWQAIAQRELGDWSAWRALLEANSDVSPGSLTPGTTLVIPNKR